eukprot:TRINITY_DN22415_c1_g1_i1.p1 TRINITY_DN22415_c1_g1~~TRINITY_DN22415_c1_g1_i1.p1  ORF type:complete len:428 (+),score=101.77 TRINITY_DN22415_c1_g1_i1:126-1409(+)
MPPPSSGRQTLLFSATFPQKIRDMMAKTLREGRVANISIGHYEDDKGGSCSSIKQILKWIPDENQRLQALMGDLQTLWMQPGAEKPSRGKVVIFTNQRTQASTLASRLGGQGINCGHLHGKLDQSMRQEIVERFRRGQTEVLVATNVAARGLDFPDICLVVQFCLPREIDTYTHRIGRTGRAGQVGCALAYCGHKDRHLGDKLVDFLELNLQWVPDFLLHQTGRKRKQPEAPKARPPSRPRSVSSASSAAPAKSRGKPTSRSHRRSPSKRGRRRSRSNKSRRRRSPSFKKTPSGARVAGSATGSGAGDGGSGGDNWGKGGGAGADAAWGGQGGDGGWGCGWPTGKDGAKGAWFAADAMGKGTSPAWGMGGDMWGGGGWGMDGGGAGAWGCEGWNGKGGMAQVAGGGGGGEAGAGGQGWGAGDSWGNG